MSSVPRSTVRTLTLKKPKNRKKPKKPKNLKKIKNLRFLPALVAIEVEASHILIVQAVDVNRRR